MLVFRLQDWVRKYCLGFKLPVSVMMAYVLLNEDVNTTQWLGIALIIAAIIIMNINWKKK
jgi:drug/metabolite transporter (DMT)-like permease